MVLSFAWPLVLCRVGGGLISSVNPFLWCKYSRHDLLLDTIVIPLTSRMGSEAWSALRTQSVPVNPALAKVTLAFDSLASEYHSLIC